MGRAERKAHRRERRQERRANIKGGLKKVGRGLGMVVAGPVAAGGGAIKARRDGATRKEATKGFFSDLNPGQGAKDVVEGSAEVVGGTIEAITADERIGRVFEAAGKLPATVMGSEERVIGDSVRLSRDLTEAGVSARGRARLVGEILIAPAATIAGDSLEGLSAFAAARGKAIPGTLMAGIHRVFGDSLHLGDVVVIENVPTFGAFGSDSPAATTAPRVIWMGDGGYATAGAPGAEITLPNLTAAESARFGAPQLQPGSVFIHELVHRWQYEHSGSDYMIKALGQQVVHGKVTAYDWRRARREHGDNWLVWPEEAAAKFIQHAHANGVFDTDSFDGVHLDPAAVPGTPGTIPATELHGLLQSALRSLWSSRASG